MGEQLENIRAVLALKANNAGGRNTDPFALRPVPFAIPVAARKGELCFLEPDSEPEGPCF
jgi:hypothetical protein